MVQNFVRNADPKFVDPFFNDAHCLKESLLFIKQQMINEKTEDFHV
jgi:hypothetical protein